MKTTMNKKLFLMVMVFAMAFQVYIFAGDDPSIKGALRENIGKAMSEYIENNTKDGVFYIYDASKRRVLRLTDVHLHSGIKKKGDFYISCADFVDSKNNTKVDVDFIVYGDENNAQTVEAILHKYGNKKTKYDVGK